MIGAIVGVTLGFAYVVGICLACCRLFHRWRPYRLPLSCTSPYHSTDGDHNYQCYRRPGACDTTGEATFGAFAASVIWPLAMLVILVQDHHPAWIVGRDLPEEREARVRALEKEAGVR